MATATQADISVSPTWTNITVGNGSLASVDVCLQNKSAYGDLVFVVFGGSQPSGETVGALLNRFDSITGNAANIWVRCVTTGKIGAIIL
jgi:hypothetical protein